MSKMQVYPISLKIKETWAVVVGGGAVAEDRVEALVECGASVTIVSPKLTSKLGNMVDRGDIEYIDDKFMPRHLEGADIALAAADDADVNSKVAMAAKNKGVLVNIADNPELCDFFLPSVVRQGGLSIAISTGGRCPALSKKVRQDLERHYGPEYQEFLQLLTTCRDRIRSKYRSPQERRRVLERVVNSEVLDLIRQGHMELAEERIDQCIL